MHSQSGDVCQSYRQQLSLWTGAAGCLLRMAVHCLLPVSSLHKTPAQARACICVLSIRHHADDAALRQAQPPWQRSMRVAFDQLTLPQQCADLELRVGDPTSLLAHEPVSPLTTAARPQSGEKRVGGGGVRGSTAQAAAAFASSTAHRLLASCTHEQLPVTGHAGRGTQCTHEETTCSAQIFDLAFV